MKKLFVAILTLGLLLLASLTPAGAEADRTFTLPVSLKVIEQEAFSNLNANTVVLPEGLERIESRAFAGSTIRSINLPASLTYIADDALEGAAVSSVTAPGETYANVWAHQHGYIQGQLQETPAEDFSYYVKDDTVTIIGYKGTDKIVIIPESINGAYVRVIGDSAFKRKKNIIYSTFP